MFSPHLLWRIDKNILSNIYLITVQVFSSTGRPIYVDTYLLWKMQDYALYSSTHSKCTQSLQYGPYFIKPQNWVSHHSTLKSWIHWSRTAQVKCWRTRGQRRYGQSRQTRGLIMHGVWSNTDLLWRDNQPSYSVRREICFTLTVPPVHR